MFLNRTAISGGICTGTLLCVLGQVAVAQTGLVPLSQLPGGSGAEEAHAVSLDGRWVVGHASSHLPGVSRESFRWSAGTGLERLGPLQNRYDGRAHGASADGSVVVGETGGKAYRWMEGTGQEFLGFPPGESSSTASDVSRDGSVVVGWGGMLGQFKGFAWTRSTQMVPVTEFTTSRVHAISADGRVAVGSARVTMNTRSRVLLWERDGGAPVLLDPPLGYDEEDIQGLGISPDGQIVCGLTGTASFAGMAFLWTAEHGYGLLPEPPFAQDCRAVAVSDGGSTVIGWCFEENEVAAIWRGTGVTGTYEAHRLEDYLVLRGIEVPPVTVLWTATGLSGDERLIVGTGYFQNDGDAYRIEFCYANCDQSTAPPYLSVDDFTCFIDKFAHAQSLPHEQQIYHYANCDNSTQAPVLTVNDFTCFINKFAQGCATP